MVKSFYDHASIRDEGDLIERFLFVGFAQSSKNSKDLCFVVRAGLGVDSTNNFHDVGDFDRRARRFFPYACVRETQTGFDGVLGVLGLAGNLEVITVDTETTVLSRRSGRSITIENSLHSSLPSRYIDISHR